MTEQPRFEMAKLRVIGWATWDPIGVGGPDHGWPADEYDTYLLQAARRLWNGQSEDEVADYLFNIETEHMGLESVPGIRHRALDVVKAIRRYEETLRS